MRIKRGNGFTLIELLIVIAIMGIMADIAVPNFQTFMAQRRLNGAARQVMSDLMAARMQAITQNRDVQVTFPTSEGASYTVDATGTPVVKNIQTLYGYYDVTVFSNNNPIFSPRGTATNLPRITLTNSRGPKYVTVAITGREKITDTP
ncbi:MAG: GspH/FimT family pseudopilin [Syntrophales bacterium]|nr:GspH/FimT family pseudopilin [Syntrophales bacterium]